MITIEGVLSEGPDLKSSAPHKWSKPLYEALHTSYRTVALSSNDQAITRWWLRREHFADWSAVLCSNGVMSYEDWRIDQIRDFQANGWEIAFLLDPDPDVAIIAQSMGVLTLKLGRPLHPPGWKPDDQAFRPWVEVADTLEARP